MSRRKRPKPLSESLFAFLRNLGIETKVREYQAIGLWPELVGEQVAKVSTAVRVSDGTLFVKVKGSAWRQELIYMKRDILSRIEQEVGKGIILDIKYN